jgi:hypothetical protein
VTDQKAPPDDEGKDRSQRGARSRGFIYARLPPANPVGRQQCQPDGDEMLLEVEEAEDLPVTSALQVWPDVDAKVQIHDPAQQSGDRIQNDDGAGERGGRHGAKTAEERTGPGARRRPGRQGLVRDRAEQHHRDQAMNDQQCGRHERHPATNSSLFI